MNEENKQIDLRKIEVRHGKVSIGTHVEGEVLLRFTRYCGTATITTDVTISEEACSALAQLLNERYDNTVPKEKFDEISKANTENLIKYFDESKQFLRSLLEAREKHPKAFKIVEEMVKPLLDVPRAALFSVFIDFVEKSLKVKRQKKHGR